MPQLVKKRRSGWAVLAVGALIASIFAAGAGSVSAQPGSTEVAARPDHRPQAAARWSACVGDAGTHEQMFTDVSDDSVHADSINCIGYYAITIGKGDGTYAPGEDVSSFQMRLFVQRAADLMGADGEAVLDSVELSDPVSRLEMARLMYGLVDDINDDVRISPSDGQIQFWDADDNEWVVVNDYFADAKAQVPIAYSQVIGATYELGITRGTMGDGTLVSTANSTFEPFEPVTRAQMASFIIRTVDHSTARPAGLTLQRNDEGNTMVSYRDADLGPVPDARIDVFSALYPDDALDDDTECVFRFVKDETPSHSTCEIDIGDQFTDDEGNVEFTLASDTDPTQTMCATSAGNYVFSSAPGSEGRTFWAWSGEDGDEVDADTDLVELERVNRPVGAAGPDYLRVSGGLPSGDELAKMGETVTFTAQLRSDTGANGRDGRSLVDDTAAGPDRSGNAYVLTIEKYWLARVAGTDSDFTPADDAAKTGTASIGVFDSAPGDWNYANIQGMAVVGDNAVDDARFQTPFDSIVWPNSDGEFPINLTNGDPRANRPDVDVGVRFTLRPFPFDIDPVDRNLLQDIVVEARTNYLGAEPSSSNVWEGHVIFSDDASDPHNVKAEVMGASTWYRIISGSRTGNTVTVSVVDQYGDPMRGIAVGLQSNLDDINRAADEVVYPEEVDLTVQARENYDGDETAEEVETEEPRLPFIRRISPSSIPNLSGQVPGVRTLRRAAFLVNAEGTGLLAVPQDDGQGTFRTRSSGAYRIGYNYTAPSAAQTETITPQSLQVEEFAISKTGDPAVLAMVDNLTGEQLGQLAAGTLVITTAHGGRGTLVVGELGAPVYVYWAIVGNSISSDISADTVGPELVEILIADVARRTIVANEGPDNGDNPRAYFYDESDTFIVDNGGATLETFEEALALTSRDNGVYADLVSWENYTLVRNTSDPNRPAQVGRTIWEITLRCSDDGPQHPRTGPGTG